MKRLKIRALHRLLARHRFLRGVEAALFWLLIVGSLYYLVGYFVVPSLAESRIQRLCGAAATVHSGRFKGLSGVHLKGVLIAADADTLVTAPIVQADTVSIRFHPWKILRGRFEVRSVAVSDCLLTADYDPAARTWNLADVSLGPPAGAKPSTFPVIRLDRGTLRVRRVTDGTPKTLTKVSLNGVIAEKTAKNEYGFWLETDGRFGFGPSRLEGGIRMDKNNPEKKCWLSGAIQTPAKGVLDNAWDLHSLQLEGALSDNAFDLGRLEFFLGQGHAVIDGRMDWADDPEMDLNIKLQQFSLAEHFAPDTLVYGQLYADLSPFLTDFLERYRPAGTADADVAVAGKFSELAAAQVKGTIHCTDISVQDQTFPYRLDKITGDIEFTGRSLQLASLRAEHGPVQVQIDGTLDNFGPQVEIDMRLSSPNLRLDEDLYHAISAPGRDPNDALLWYQISPQGVCKLDFHFQRFADGGKDRSVQLDLVDVSAMYKYFQYPLRQMTGKVVIEPGRIGLETITSKYDDGSRIVIDGQILNARSDDRDYHITCRGERIPVDQRLIKAMAPPQQAVFERIDIDAAADFSIEVFPDQFNKKIPGFLADIELTGESLEFKGFPLPMTDITLSAALTPRLLRINRFDAGTESGHIRLRESTLWPQGRDPNRPGCCVNLDLKDFRLNEAFWQAAGPDAEDMLGKLRVYGAVDANGLLELNLPKTRCRGNHLTIDCRDNPVQWDSVELGHIDGRLTVNDANIVFSEFVLHEVPLQSLPQEFMNEKAQKVYAAVSPEGPLTIRIDDGWARMGAHGPVAIDMQAAIDTRELLIGPSQPPNRLGGICEGHLVIDTETGYWDLSAQYDIDHYQYRNWLITGLSGEIVHDAETHRLQSSNFQAEFYGGRVIGNLELELDEVPEYNLELNYDGVELSKLPALAGKGAADDRAKSGTVSGRLALTGELDDLAEPRGKLNATVKDLEMGRQSLLGKMLTAVQFKHPDDYVFHEIDLAAEILGSKLILDRVRIIGNPIVFDGTGTMNLKDRQLAIVLTAWDRIVSDKQSILDMLARGIGSALWKVEVHGDMDAPQVDAVYLSVLKKPLEIFKEKDE